MADEKNLQDNLDDMLGDAKEGAAKAADKASELAGEAKEAISDFADDAKDVARDFSNSAKEAFNGSSENKKMIAGILGILLGGFGIHKFYLGYNKEGLIQIAATLITCGAASIIGLIEGIIYLTKSDEEFYNTYQVGQKTWF